MSGGGERLEHRGSLKCLAGQMAAAFLPLAAVTSLLVFGSAGWRLFLASLILLPLLLLFAWGVSRVDRLRFDDEERALKRPLRRPVSYDDVARLRLVESMGAVQAAVKTKRGRGEILLLGLHPLDADGLCEAIAGRCPGVAVHRVEQSGWKIVAAAVTLLLTAYTAGWFLMTRKAPELKTACAESAAAAGGSAAVFVRSADGVRVTLPREAGEAPHSIMSSPGLRLAGGAGSAFLSLAGIESETELFRYAACARYGVVPLVLKSALLSQWEDPRIHTFSGPARQAVLVMGRRDGIREARILVRNTESGAEALIAVRETDLMELEVLPAALSAITVERAR